MVGRLTKVDLREVWKKEAKDFTTWLENNLDILSEQINFKLLALEREKAVGPFSVDIYAEGPNGFVVIENQLEKTNHTHLGQIITYLSNLEAKTAIWITSEPQPEHITAINWMNDIAPADVGFFLVKVEAYKIDDSEPAPLFTAICEPSPEGKIISDTKRDLAEKSINNLKFWEELLKKAQSKTDLHSNVSPSKYNWITAGAGKSGMGWAYAFTRDKAWVELYIDRGPDKKQETDAIFEKLLAEKENIERQFGEPLIWDKTERHRICRIKSLFKIDGMKDMESWGQIQDDLVDRMVRLEKSLKIPLSKII
jgi:hypothetical protein